VGGRYQALLGLLIAGLLIAGFAYRRKIRLEEENLRNAFGARYDAYRHETDALLPRLM
jgi:protein-S-isoprenylcysteine O-methyltransferase Ste14